MEPRRNHRVHIGTGYNNDKACVVFVELIAQEQREALLDVVSKARFFAL